MIKLSNKVIVTKKRYWAILLYPDSLPENYLEVLKNTGLRFALSPLHDKDVDEDNKLKKAHYHGILCYNSPTTYSNVAKLCESLNQPIPKPIDNIVGAYEYFYHKNDIDKYQYNAEDITTYNGFEITDFLQRSRSEINKLKYKVFEFIREKNITEFCDLCDILLDNGFIDELETVTCNVMLFDRYLHSRRYCKK